MLVHCEGRKFLVLVPLDATVLDCKKEVLRVYRAISGSSNVEHLFELQDSNHFTLFDDYIIGMLLPDKSEVFATTQLSQGSQSPASVSVGYCRCYL